MVTGDEFLMCFSLYRAYMKCSDQTIQHYDIRYVTIRQYYLLEIFSRLK